MIDDLLVARVTTTIVHGGRSHRIRRGETVVYADDPVVRGREKLFRPLTVTQLGPRPARAVETATADPGERRELQLPPSAPIEEDAEEDATNASRAQTLDVPYHSWTRKELAAECKARDLSASGTKDELVARLKANEPDGD